MRMGHVPMVTRLPNGNPVNEIKKLYRDSYKKAKMHSK